MEGWCCVEHDMVVQTCNPSTWQKPRGLPVWGQPGIHSMCLKKKKKNSMGFLSMVLNPKLPEGGNMLPHAPSSLWNLPFLRRETTVLWGKKNPKQNKTRLVWELGDLVTVPLLCGSRRTSQPLCFKVPTGKIELLTFCQFLTQSASDFYVSKWDNRC